MNCNLLSEWGTGKLHRLERCFLDWTNQCKSHLPLVAKSAFLQTATAALAYLVQSMKHFSAVVIWSLATLASYGRQLLHRSVQSKTRWSNLRFSTVHNTLILIEPDGKPWRMMSCQLRRSIPWVPQWCFSATQVCGWVLSRGLIGVPGRSWSCCASSATSLSWWTSSLDARGPSALPAEVSVSWKR